MRATTELLVRRALRRAVASIGLPVHAVITAWPRLDVFGACGEARRVWWAQDDFAAGAALMGQNARAVQAGEARRAGGSDLVVAANPIVANRWRQAGRRVVLIPFGADPESFAAVGDTPAHEPPLKPPIAVLVGQLNERVQPDLLVAVADRGISILLVGPEARTGADWLPSLTARENVCWVGPQPFAALPGLLTHASVGLVPYADTPFNRGSFPLKLLEYLAAGIPAVSTGLPAALWLDAPPEHIAIADEPRAFADAVLALAQRPLTPAVRAERRAFAAARSWDARAAQLLSAVDACPGSR
jgi:glycosyltransferase involved in cell wall biosynthesis